MDKALIKKVAEYTLEQAHGYTDETANTKDLRRWHRWDWSIGVGLYGVLKANQILQEEQITKSVKLWIDQRLDDIPSICVNTCGVMPAVLEIAQQYGMEKYKNVIAIFDDYVMNKAIKTPCGAIAHSVIGSELPGEIWADTLFMCVLYMAKRGKMLADQNMLAEAGRQLYLHVDKLFDPEEGLFYHGYDDINGLDMGTLWGRGNAWVTVATVEILDTIGTAIDSNMKNEILQKLSRQLDALTKYQLPCGMWATVVNHPQHTYQESSITAGVAYGILAGASLGYFHTKYLPVAHKAIDALKANISSNGAIEKGSTGTPIKEDVTAYNQIPYFVTPFTQGLALMALCV